MKRLIQAKERWSIPPQEISDEGPPGYDAGTGTLTFVQRGGWIDINVIKNLPGASGEEDYVKWRTLPNGIKMFGNYTEKEWEEFVDSIKNGFKEDFPIFIRVEKDGRKEVAEGNHRLRAALEAGYEYVPVYIAYYGNSQRKFKF